MNGGEVRLTPTEYRGLALLAQHAGKVLTHRQILREVWGPNATETHYVRVQMAEIRKKIEADPARPRLLVTEPGVATGFATGSSEPLFGGGAGVGASARTLRFRLPRPERHGHGRCRSRGV